MPNETAGLKFAIEGLRDLEAERFVIKRISKSIGRGVFLKKGVRVTKGTFLMQYSGRITDAAPVPENQYTLRIRQNKQTKIYYGQRKPGKASKYIYVDASNQSHCTGKDCVHL